ncbi:hypothetical protein [[Clostridium] scindens]|uniref:hypothetical protein n=1 Tax=Clostridium scindens (strain JCM 10418 / VPI 12708) TaxID=29347 RepID=UPI00298CA419|nr:hypothetical protein [[Clostridium] scindens]WPB39506.1 hypothetical protein DEGADCKI_00813 [[Clostridium] scindens]
MDTTTYYTVAVIEESNLRYSNTVFNNLSEGDGSITLIMTKWLKGSTGWATDTAKEYVGKYLLSFNNDTFYNQIDLVMIDHKSMEKHDNGSLWTIPIDEIPRYSWIDVVTNNKIT